MSKVFWITGLSGSGKTTIGREVYQLIREKKKNVVFLDGDQLRDVFGQDLGYSKQDRLQCAKRYSRICQLLVSQDIDVVICTISMFNEIREWNRENIIGYYEIFIKVPIEILQKRDQKGLYSGFKSGTSMDVVGLDLQLQFPTNPDMIINNTGDVEPKDIAKHILTTSSKTIN